MTAEQEKELLEKVEKLSTGLDAALKLVDAKTKEIEGLQSIHGKHASELGEIRKKQEELDKAKGDVEKLKLDLEKKLEDLKGSGSPRGAAGTGGQSKKHEDMTVDELEAALSDEQRKTVEQVYSAMPDNDPNAPVDKMRVNSDEAVRKQFFIAALSEVPSIPKSPWKKPAEGAKPSAGTDALRALFKTEQKRGTYVPPGPSSSSPRVDLSGGSGMLSVLKQSREKVA